MFTMGADLSGDSWDTKRLKEENKTFQKIEKSEHQLVFTKEKRRGKTVTLVGRFFISNKEKKELLKLLKTKLGCGGSIKDEWIELQGDIKHKVIDILKPLGWRFKS